MGSKKSVQKWNWKKSKSSFTIILKTPFGAYIIRKRGNWFAPFFVLGHTFGMKKLSLLCTAYLMASCGADSTSGEGTDGVGASEHRAFVTSGTYSGGLGGLSGADSTCSSAASAAGLSRTYNAILSDSSTSADDRLAFSGSIYVVDSNDEKTLVAGSGSELWNTSSNDLTNQINIDENGDTVTADDYVWTGTTSEGGAQIDNCSDWTSSSSSINGDYGNLDLIDSGWIKYGFDTCEQSFHLYCVSQ